MQTGELQSSVMALTAEEVLDHLRALPPRERLKLVEQVKQETTEAERQPTGLSNKPPILDDLTDEEFADFLETIARNRREQPMRTPR
jgi:DNA-binding TFAR19-related protein (PDSD5 family)